ncbi:unnamed protein product [Sphagnum tenellum]
MPQQQLLPRNPKSSPQLPTQPPPCFLYVDAGSVRVYRLRKQAQRMVRARIFELACGQPHRTAMAQLKMEV